MSDNEIGDDPSDGETEVAEVPPETQAAVELPTLAAQGVAWSLDDAEEDHSRSRWRNRLVCGPCWSRCCARYRLPWEGFRWSRSRIGRSRQQ